MIDHKPYHKACHVHQLDKSGLAFANIWEASRISEEEYKVGKIMMS
jgi:hypothetical protein